MHHGNQRLILAARHLDARMHQAHLQAWHLVISCISFPLACQLACVRYTLLWRLVSGTSSHPTFTSQALLEASFDMVQDGLVTLIPPGQCTPAKLGSGPIANAHPWRWRELLRDHPRSLKLMMITVEAVWW